MLINITQEDIDSGTRRSTVNCAIAKTFKRIYNNEFLDVVVTTGSLELNGRHYVMPHLVKDFIHAFDNDTYPVKPMTIEIPELD